MSRQLYSLDTNSRGDQVKWPSSSDEAGEDFVKFKKDFIDACKQNRVSLNNQITKLRENLKGYTKSLIPVSLTDVDKALTVLERACGDSMRVVNHRLDNLMNLGPWPPDGKKDCYAK